MLLKQDEFKMQDSPKAGFWDYFQNFKQAYESCRLGVLGMCDYKYTGGYLNSQFESCDPISNTLNVIEMISGRESISPYSAVVNNSRKLQSEMTSGELPLLTSTISKGLSVAGKTAKSAVTEVAKEGMDVGKQIWSSTKNRTSVQNAYSHWKDHGKEFSGIQNSKQYVEKTWEFLRSPPNETLFKYRSNGDRVLYHPKSNTFGIESTQGIPRTRFKPDPNVHQKASNLVF